MKTQNFKESGEKKILLTCDKTNEASRKTIIKNGGVLESEISDGVDAPTHSTLLKKNKQLQIIEKSMVWSFIF